MSKVLHEQFFKDQVIEIKKNFDNYSELVIDYLRDLKGWSIKEAKDYYIDELSDLSQRASELFETISNDLEEEVSRSEDEDTEKPFDGAAEPEEVYANG